ncbi:CBS domain-containing protein [Parafrankia sp. BMG5.11]|uniref:CBS domain-containing protein n=1 Tax=Parafrankia sp. BMG5.11 TaxID=222540 RepID=UPI0010392CDA|nr:CBS domain-containing protein [Parafrankia sp. BMG5.11]TCJ41111.1 CBS domain-containing protein [Parafrankia sp. BMG5.11]
MDVAHLLSRRQSAASGAGPGAEIVTCDVAMTMRDALSILATRRIGALPVMQHGQVVGVFSERDVIYCLEREGEASLDKPVGEVMTAPAITIEPATRIDDALEMMTRRRIRHLPVVQNGGMCGFVSIGDLVKAQIDEIAGEAEAMRVYIQTA